MLTPLSMVRRWLLLLVRMGMLLGLAGSVAADSIPEAEQVQPTIAIIMDDLGYDLSQGEQVLQLPGPVTMSFLPRTPHAAELAEQAHGVGKEVMLHLPMESSAARRPGPGGLTAQMSEQDFLGTLYKGLDEIPHVAGVNNHMGSLLTRHEEAMQWLMQGLENYRDGKLYFIDSRTTAETVAEAKAREFQLPTARRDVFLDNSTDAKSISRQFRQLLKLAKARGSALGICHPHSETLAVLKKELARLDQEGIKLVPASELIRIQQRSMQWQTPSSPSLKVAKSSKQ